MIGLEGFSDQASLASTMMISWRPYLALAGQAKSAHTVLLGRASKLLTFVLLCQWRRHAEYIISYSVTELIWDTEVIRKASHHYFLVFDGQEGSVRLVLLWPCLSSKHLTAPPVPGLASGLFFQALTSCPFLCSETCSLSFTWMTLSSDPHHAAQALPPPKKKPLWSLKLPQKHVMFLSPSKSSLNRWHLQDGVLCSGHFEDWYQKPVGHENASFILTLSGLKCKRLSALTFVQKVTSGQRFIWRLHGG